MFKEPEEEEVEYGKKVEETEKDSKKKEEEHKYSTEIGLDGEI